jgi:hypothetical protein
MMSLLLLALGCANLITIGLVVRFGCRRTRRPARLPTSGGS